MFIVCDSNAASGVECGLNEVFNVDIQFCVPGNPDTCEVSRPEVACGGRPDGIVPHPDECRQYILCIGGSSIVQDCPLGQILRPEVPVCVAGNSDTCEFMDDVCSDLPNGWVVEHPNHCDLFILCEHGTTNIHSCPTGSILRPDMQFCVPGDANTCTNTPIGGMCTGIVFPQRFPHPELCDRYIVCQNEEIIILPCLDDHIVEPGTIECVPGNPNTCSLYTHLCFGRPDGLIAHPSNCRRFIECRSGFVILGTCPAGQIWDPNTGVCVIGNTETCDNLSDFCVGLADGVHPHPNYCHLFVLCSNGQTAVHNCPAGEILRPDMQFCVPGVGCEPTPLERMCESRDGVRYPHPDYCSLWVNCINGVPSVENCPDGTIIEPGTIQCVAGNSETCTLHTHLCSGIQQDVLPHPDLCHVFLRCESSQTLTSSCPRGTIFHPDARQCQIGDRESCTSLQNTCTQLADQVLPHPNFCDITIECRDSITLMRMCAPGLILHHQMQVCSPGNAQTCTLRDFNTMCSDHLQGVFPVPDQNQCADFVICNGFIPLLRTCRTGSVLRPRFIECVPGNEDTCEFFPHICLFRPPNDIIPHPIRCDMFVMCISEMPNIVDCPTGQIYVDSFGFCVPGDTWTCTPF
ncbi:uncharacterized protein LOC129743280 [Uranotaenia lowii]|uniref:uncharacterized protein LOC129743280 n=1 Tax=Uranotaenia lowii TaxID=190385 RepID=UPI00247AAB57|nr:uncharacterized protein LOC129743280 [Uranotaenia lowii]